MRRQGGLPAFGVVSLIVVALLASLGFWQLRRLAWKEALIASVDARAHTEPVDAPPQAAWPALDPSAFEYAHLRAVGALEPKASALIFATPLDPKPGADGPGFLVVTPLRLGGGGSVLVSRGFIAQSKAQAFLAEDAKAAPAPVAFTGLARFDEPRRWFAPQDDLAAKTFYSRDVGAIAKALGVEDAAPFLIEAEASPGGPLAGGQTRLAFANSHLAYALTWFALALAWAAAFGVFAWSRRRL